jgi:hypothetical protein
MKPHLRRAQGSYPYFKVATWDPRSLTFRDGKNAHATKEEALRSVSGPGKYRLSIVTADGRTDLPSFDVGEMVGGD